ncbi:MAG TPA: thioredoxin family protein [Polyangiaceae bacterium]|nr:thioredoxin family protein [Polyangiaceae bacterium]
MASNTASATTPPPVAQAAVAPTPEPSPSPPAAHGVEWKGNVQWHTWEEGLSIAAKESKPILVLVYADWCPHCRALGPVFADPEVEALATHLVMVRQNHDEDPSWLQPYNQKYGGYVPRIFFFDSTGKIREDLTSGHPRYPFFYAAEASDLLKRSMRRAISS